MGTYITIASVRRTCGIGASEISNDDVEDTITEIEKQVPRFFNTVYTPTERIDILNGDGTNRLLLDKNPLLGVRELKIDGETEDPANLEIYKDSGYIFLGEDADTSKFINKRNAIVVKYIYGLVEESSTETTSTAAEVAGTTVEIGVVDDTDDYSVDDWIEIYSMDGNREVAKITATGNHTLTVDKLVLAHESGSKIVKLEVSENFKKLMNLITSIALVARIVGESYKDTVGYSLGELQVQKGEPYTQWRETAVQFIRERDLMFSRIGIRPYII